MIYGLHKYQYWYDYKYKCFGAISYQQNKSKTDFKSAYLHFQEPWLLAIINLSFSGAILFPFWSDLGSILRELWYQSKRRNRYWFQHHKTEFVPTRKLNAKPPDKDIKTSLYQDHTLYLMQQGTNIQLMMQMSMYWRLCHTNCAAQSTHSLYIAFSHVAIILSTSFLFTVHLFRQCVLMDVVVESHYCDQLTGQKSSDELSLYICLNSRGIGVKLWWKQRLTCKCCLDTLSIACIMPSCSKSSSTLFQSSRCFTHRSNVASTARTCNFNSRLGFSTWNLK